MKEKYVNLFTGFGFTRAFIEEANKADSTSIARLQPEERQPYESNLAYYRDLKNVIDTAWDEGHAKGQAEGSKQNREERVKQAQKDEKRVMATRMINLGMLSDQQIAEITGLAADEVKQVRQQN